MSKSIKQLLLTLIFLSGTLFLASPTSAYAQTNGRVTCAVNLVNVTLNADAEVTIDEINDTYGTSIVQVPIEGDIEGSYLLLIGPDQLAHVVIWQMSVDERISGLHVHCDGEHQTEGSPSYGW